MIVPFLDGGLGNQLFQIGAGYALAARLGAPLRIDPELRFENPHSPRTYARHFYPEFVGAVDTAEAVHFEEREDEFGRYSDAAERWCREHEGKVRVLHGFFQSERFLLDCRDEVRKRIDAQLASDYGDRRFDAAFLHLRLRDYLDYRVDLPANYFAQARGRFPGDVLGFSDDVAAARERLADVPGVRWVDEPDELRALWWMSRCGHGGVAANSTLSWWAGFLHAGRFPDAIRVFPTPHFPHVPRSAVADYYSDWMSVQEVTWPTIPPVGLS